MRPARQAGPAVRRFPPSNTWPCLPFYWLSYICCKPKGVPCLYLATNSETAMMETRPWAGSVLTISQLVLLKQVMVVDCTLPATFNLDVKTQEQLESNSWYVLNEAFSLPVFQAEDVADYAPTQYIAEAFRAAGYGGIMYTSQVGKGKNIALFDVHAAEVASRQVRRAKKLSFTFAEVGAVPMKNNTETNSKRVNKSQNPEPKCDLEATTFFASAV